MAGKTGPSPTTPADMVEAIRRSDKPVLTVGDIAERLDVSPETVRRKRDKLESHGAVKYTKVGRATAYWVEEPEPEPETVEPRTPEPPEREPEPQTEDDDESYFWRLITQRIRSVERHRHLITVLSVVIPGLMTTVAVAMLFQAFGLAPLFVAGVAVLIPVQFTMMVVSHAAMLYILSTRSQTDTSPIQKQQRVDQ